MASKPAELRDREFGRYFQAPTKGIRKKSVIPLKLNIEATVRVGRAVGRIPLIQKPAIGRSNRSTVRG